jgi:hypothetical protein
MIMESELKVTATGACRYCGQTLTIDWDGESWDQAGLDAAATRECECSQAKDERIASENREKTLRDAEMQIRHMFTGGGMEEGYGWLSVSNETAALLNTIARLVYDGDIKAAAIQLTPVNKASIGKTGKGKLTIARDDTIKNKQEV